MSQKIFDNDSFVIWKSKITLTFNKPAYGDICILDLGKVLMYKFYYDYIKNKYDTDSLMYEIETERWRF